MNLLSIPNFCLDLQPSGIPLTFAWISFWFSTHQVSLYRLWTHFLFLFFFLSFFFFLTSSLLLSFPFFQIWPYETLQLFHPTLGYEKWLRVVMKWVHIAKKVYEKSNQLKERKTNRPPWYAPDFIFLHFMILMSFIMNLMKDWNVPRPL